MRLRAKAFTHGTRRTGFREREKKRLLPLKPLLFSASACAPGTYGRTTHGFCLADGYSAENLHPSIRDDALAYFQRRGISWHAGNGAGRSLPSSHLCCSQSACVNFWFPFVRDAVALGGVLSNLGYSVSEVLPFGADLLLPNGQAPYVAFEWIGLKNYLGELKGRRRAADGERKRGARFTSADFAFRFRRADNQVQVVLGEWKYTERYPVGRCIQTSRSGTDRLAWVYREHLSKPDCQIRLPAGVAYENLFYDPFDQMMRLQLLASAMERAHENADVVSVLHVAPKANSDLMDRITSPRLGDVWHGLSIHEVQKALVVPDRFKGVFMEDLLASTAQYASDANWLGYLELRYGGAA